MKTKKEGVGAALKGVKRKKGRTEPLWKGPEVDGITQSMLNDFMFCRERFRIKNILGWDTPETFNSSIEYGNMFHLCEEATGQSWNWESSLKKYIQNLIKLYPLQQEQIAKWYNVCLRQYPVYLEWRKKQMGKKKPPKTLLTEYTFEVPYPLPSGRTVKLKGKWDEVLLDAKKGLRLKENKTKGTIDEELLKKQLKFDLQTMTYVTALYEYLESGKGKELFGKDYGLPTGLVYNVVRRPLSGGRGSIKQLKGSKNVKPETLEVFYDRLERDYFRKEPEYFFHRWEVEITHEDVDKFETEFLTPILEQLCDWYEQVTQDDLWNNLNEIHWTTPYGIWNPLARGAATELDAFIETGSTVGLVQRDRLFKELD